ncbi:MAG: hypothetical protein AMXMBFR84_28110 [Candidatus Hydrogenedentota bacterium]
MSEPLGLTNSKRRFRLYAIAVAIALLGYAGWYLLQGWPVLVAGGLTRPAMPADAFELAIATDKTEYGVGEKVAITAILTNRSGKTVYLARPLDGSERGRSPVARFTVEAPPSALPKEQLGLCGNTNPIDTGAFVEVPDGGSLPLVIDGGFWLNYELNRGAGEYRIQMTYSTEATEPSAWVGGPMQPLAENRILLSIAPYLSCVPRIKVVSNEVVLSFKSRYPSPIAALQQGDLEAVKFGLREIEAMDTAARPADYTTAALDALTRLYAASDYAYHDVAALAMPLLASDAREKDADLFWSMLEPERRWAERRVYLDQGGSNMGAYVLAVTLKSSEALRADRLQYLTHSQNYETDHAGQTLDPIPLDMRTIRVLVMATGSDVDRAIVGLAGRPELFYEGAKSEEAKLLRQVMDERGLTFPESSQAKSN